MTAQEIIRFLDLKPHPEGGYYRETYRSFEAIPGSKTFCGALDWNGKNCIGFS